MDLCVFTPSLPLGQLAVHRGRVGAQRLRLVDGRCHLLGGDRGLVVARVLRRSTRAQEPPQQPTDQQSGDAEQAPPAIAQPCGRLGQARLDIQRGLADRQHQQQCRQAEDQHRQGDEDARAMWQVHVMSPR